MPVLFSQNGKGEKIGKSTNNAISIYNNNNHVRKPSVASSDKSKSDPSSRPKKASKAAKPRPEWQSIVPERKPDPPPSKEVKKKSPRPDWNNDTGYKPPAEFKRPKTPPLVNGFVTFIACFNAHFITFCVIFLFPLLSRNTNPSLT